MKTALNTTLVLASTNKHRIQSCRALKAYDKVVNKYNNALPISRRLTIIREKIQQPEPKEPQRRGQPQKKQVPRPS